MATETLTITHRPAKSLAEIMTEWEKNQALVTLITIEHIGDPGVDELYAPHAERLDELERRAAEIEIKTLDDIAAGMKLLKHYLETGGFAHFDERERRLFNHIAAAVVDLSVKYESAPPAQGARLH